MATGAPRNIFLKKCVLAWLVLSDSSLVIVKDCAFRCLDLVTQKILLGCVTPTPVPKCRGYK